MHKIPCPHPGSNLMHELLEPMSITQYRLAKSIDVSQRLIGEIVTGMANAAPDKAVDAAYLAAEKAASRKPPKLSTDAERVAFLFQRYQALTSLLPVVKEKKARKKTGAAR